MGSRARGPRPTGGSSISPCQSALTPAFPRPEFSRLSAAQRARTLTRLLAGTAGRSWRGKRAVPGGWGPAKRLMEHSWAGPPGWRRRETARVRRLRRHWPLGCTAVLLAWPCARARPSRFPSQVNKLPVCGHPQRDALLDRSYKKPGTPGLMSGAVQCHHSRRGHTSLEQALRNTESWGRGEGFPLLLPAQGQQELGPQGVGLPFSPHA